jgi:hypothetical protein
MTISFAPEVFCATTRSAGGSRRRRLWELGGHAHCPVVGVCLPMPELRRLVGKLFGVQANLSDYELHCAAIADCQRRTPFARLVHSTLDKRSAQALRESSKLKTTAELALWWREYGQKNALDAALWATITHAYCMPELENEVLGEVHMLQHQVGIAKRLDVARFEALIHENAVLGRELAKVQVRATRQAQTHARCVDVQQTQILQLRAKVMVGETALALVQQDMQALKASVPELKSRLDLQGALQRQVEQIAHLQREPVPLEVAEAAAPQATEFPITLYERSVLCVGGRPASVPIYRDLVEKTGGQFLHHDGGQEESVAQLESTLAAADLVICQTGCISHDAYWRVKNHCKRTGKPCVFMDTPSSAGLKRALVALVPLAV